MATTVASRKAKGRRAQQYLVSRLIDMFRFSENDVKSIPGSVPGPDVWLSQTAIDKIGNWDFEVKNIEKLNIWGALKQLYGRSPNKEHALVFTRNNDQTYVTVTLTQFLILLFSKMKLGDILFKQLEQHE